MGDAKQRALERLGRAERDADALAYAVEAIQRSLARLRARVASPSTDGWTYGGLTSPLSEFHTAEAAMALQELVDTLALSGLGDDRDDRDDRAP